MQTKTDAQLLREYAGTGSETAFGELVSRHADLVYSAALRQVIDPDFARDVAQSVFADLARKAKSLSGNIVLAGWLYRSTRFAALTFLRNERRRQNRERQAMQLLDPARESSPDWERIRPVLDEAMAKLGDGDRDALVLRFFKNEDLRTNVLPLIEFRDQRLSDAIATLARNANLNPVFDPGVVRRLNAVLSIRLENVTYKAALEAIVKLNRR